MKSTTLFTLLTLLLSPTLITAAPTAVDIRNVERPANVQEKRVAMPTQAASSGSGVTGNPNKPPPPNEAELKDPYGIVWDYVDTCKEKVRRGEELEERCE